MATATAEALGLPPPRMGLPEFGTSTEEGLLVIPNLRRHSKLAQSEYAACLPVLLDALKWTGRPRHLSEAIPHFVDNISIDDFRETLANLNLATAPIRTSQNRINPGLLPCLFVPDKGSARIVLEHTEQDGKAASRIFDGFTRSTRTSVTKGIRGTAYPARAIDSADVERDEGTWIAELLTRFRKLVVQVLIATFMINILSLAMPLFMMSIYDTVIPSASIQQLLFLVSGVGLAIGIEWLFRRMRSAVMAHAAGRIDYMIGVAGFRQVLMLPIPMSENEPIGAQISHLQEFESVREFFAGPLAETIVDLPFVLITIGLIALLSGWLVMVPITAAALLILIALTVAPFIKRTFANSGGSKSRQQRFLIEAVSGMRAIKFAGAESVWIDRFRTFSAGSAINDFRIAMLNHLVQTFGKIVMMGAGVAVVGFGAIMVMDNALSIGAMVATMALGWRVLGPFQSVIMLLNRATQIRSSLRQINHLMRLNPERASGEVPPKRTVKGRITFNGVGYRHTPDADPALNGVSFECAAGEVLAITGPNGAGKTTVANLASGLYKPQIGSVLLDGVDFRQIDPVDIRQKIGLVPQNSELLYGTVAQNLRLSVVTASDEDIKHAARLADIHEAVIGLPEGYDTRLTERVLSELPEGFKQKLSIARALLRRPPILIFDEPGQMLDERGDKAFIQAVKSLKGECTIIIITHRPSHMRVADRLVALHNGRLVFDGDPEEALTKMEGSES
ncbi:MAG: ATP-binding cassette domain-containing protein [Alphaproteobacteria bacterium]|nr:ATP-binding cassette domain-containing protein [Alphaproteobacteria bacterium]